MIEQDVKRLIPFSEVVQAIRKASLPPCDLVVGIGSGGVVPASLIAFQLEVPLEILWLNYRTPDNKPRFVSPRLVCNWTVPREYDTILLVDDVSVSGKTLTTAQRFLADASITTLVLKGQADIVLFPNISTCVYWPWHTTQPEN